MHKIYVFLFACAVMCGCHTASIVPKAEYDLLALQVDYLRGIKIPELSVKEAHFKDVTDFLNEMVKSCSCGKEDPALAVQFACAPAIVKSADYVNTFSIANMSVLDLLPMLCHSNRVVLVMKGNTGHFIDEQETKLILLIEPIDAQFRERHNIPASLSKGEWLWVGR